jgi:hypothetical protein
MKINNQFLSIPPYISTRWSSVFALYTKDNQLVISLADGEVVEIPDLNEAVLHEIFSAHASFMEMEVSEMKAPLDRGDGGNPFRFGFSTLDGFSGALQHNPSQADAPEIPKEVLEKISAIAKVVTPDISSLPKAEPHCNCMFCQIARAVHGDAPEKQEPLVLEEAVAEEELQFQDWNIAQKGEQLFTVTNKLDPNESYNVFLGEPVGCTCGQAGCQHLLAVLRG